MTKPEFKVLLIAASFVAVRYGQGYVNQTLPFVFRYQVHLNNSYDENKSPDDVLYPEDDGKVLEANTEDEAVALLWRDGRCPEWIDIAVQAATPDFTLLKLRCCGRYTATRERLYYQEKGFGPFGIKSPMPPPNWRNGVRFDLKPPLK